jgi:hypothetical protein
LIVNAEVKKPTSRPLGGVTATGSGIGVVPFERLGCSR